jgi:predicted nuclease of predicted toxin-antitoxin system
MKIWIDAQLPPALANWLSPTFGVEAVALGNTTSDFVVTCGNVTNRNLRRLLTATLPDALEQLRQGTMIVEISNTL